MLDPLTTRKIVIHVDQETGEMTLDIEPCKVHVLKAVAETMLDMFSDEENLPEGLVTSESGFLSSMNNF